MWCPNCGTKLDDGAKFCPNCGTKVQNDIIKPVSENRMEPESEWDGQIEDENDYSGYADLDLEDDEKKVSKMPLIMILVIVIVGILVGVGAYMLVHHNTRKDAVQKTEEMVEDSAEKEDKKSEDKDETKAAEEEEEADKADPANITAKLTTTPSGLSSYGKLSVQNATATSVVDQEGHDNSANMVLDGRDETSWQEGVDGTGTGERLTFQFGGECKVKYMSLKLGNWRSSDYYWKNNRPKTLEITTDKGTTATITFPDEQKECWIEFSEDCPVSDINITIQDVYRGTSTTWNDTCIAGIEFYGAAN